MKKKILILISSDMYIRNYIRAKAFTKIEKKHDCYYLALKNEVKLIKDLKKKKILLAQFYINRKILISLTLLYKVVFLEIKINHQAFH